MKEQYIIVNGNKFTKTNLKEKFNEYNKLYFNNKLGKCKLYFFSKNIHFFGKYVDTINKKGEIISKIYIGQNTIWTEENLKEILVHEMIHMYIRTVENKKFDGLLGHGNSFRKYCKKLKKEFGLIINIHPKFDYINKSKPKLWEKIILWIIDR
jgi:hypothetical protein